MASSSPLFEVLRRFRHHKPGDVVPLEDTDAERFVRLGAVRPAKKAEQAKPEPSGDGPAPADLPKA